MRGAPIRPGLWIAGAILGLTLAGACNLNPQPLPPESDHNAASDDASTIGGSSSGSSSGSSGVGLSSSSGAGSSSGSSSGASTGSPADAGNIVAQDASLEDGGGATGAVDAAADTGLASDAASDSRSPDAALDDASPGDAACVHASDCYASHPGACALCMWPLNYPVCAALQCGCACDERDAAGE
jgi:hypothetical protein